MASRAGGPAGGAKEHKDSKRRIDAAVAAVMAHDRAAALAGDRGPSIYVRGRKRPRGSPSRGRSFCACHAAHSTRKRACQPGVLHRLALGKHPSAAGTRERAAPAGGAARDTARTRGPVTYFDARAPRSLRRLGRRPPPEHLPLNELPENGRTAPGTPTEAVHPPRRTTPSARIRALHHPWALHELLLGLGRPGGGESVGPMRPGQRAAATPSGTSAPRRRAMVTAASAKPAPSVDCAAEAWPSGRRHTPGKRVGGSRSLEGSNPSASATKSGHPPAAR